MNEHHAADQLHREYPGVASIPTDTVERGYRSSHTYEEKILGAVATLGGSGTEDITETETSSEKEKQPESVLKLLNARKETGYRRGVDDDGHKIGLTFDPGAYAGVISLSMAKELQAAGLLDYVDSVYGLSAGGVNAAYVATGQIDEGIDTYVRLMPSMGFLTPGKKFPPKPPKIDLAVLREAVTKIHPLKLKELLDKKLPVVVGVKDLSSNISSDQVFKSTKVDRDNPEQFIDQLIMGCNIPGIAGGPIEGLNGHLYSDATLFWADSVELAVHDQCTEILSLANTPVPNGESQSFKNRFGGFMQGIVGDIYMFKNLSPEIKKQVIDERTYPYRHPIRHLVDSLLNDDSVYYFPSYRKAIARKTAAENAFSKGLFVTEKGVTVERIYPPDDPNLPELLTSDPYRLRVGIAAGSLAVQEAMKSTAAMA